MALALVIAIAVITVAIPTCQMIGCQMDMSNGMMRVWTHGGPSIANTCGGMWITSTSTYGVAPSEFTTALLSLFVAIAAAIALFSPRLELRPVRVIDANGPPPPLEPRGERFTV